MNTRRDWTYVKLGLIVAWIAVALLLRVAIADSNAPPDGAFPQDSCAFVLFDVIEEATGTELLVYEDATATFADASEWNATTQELIDWINALDDDVRMAQSCETWS